MANSQRPSKARVLSRTGLIILITLLVVPAWAQEFDTKKSSGLGVGATNNGVDPSRNVLDLVNAAIKRQDDLRDATKELFDAKLTASNSLDMLRGRYDKEFLKAATDRLDSEARLRAEFQAIIAATEKARVDAIRLVDTGNVAAATIQATATANTLAKTVTDTAQALSTQVTQNADRLQLLVKTTADENTRNVQQQFTGVQTQFTTLTTRLTALEQAGAEGVGRQKFQGPDTERLSRLVETLSQRQAITSGADQGSTTTWALVGAIFVMLMTFGGLLLNMRRQLVANGKPT